VQLSGNSDQNTLRIYPNPTPGATQIEATYKAAGVSNIRVVGQNGQLLRQYKKSVQIGLNRIPLDISDLPKGLYIIQVSEPGQPEFRSIRLSKQ
jgi:hypothetical protein